MARKLLLGTLGAAGMFLFDRQMGRRRRAILRDRLVSLGHRGLDGIELGARDLAHRLQGLAAEARHLVTDGDADDETIQARVRSALGRIVQSPRDIEVISSGGIVTLSGRVAAEEFDAVIGCVRSMRGVHGVNNDLDVVHGVDTGGHASSRGRTLELMQHNWSPAARLVSSVAGGWLAAHGVRRGGAIGVAETAIGSLLFLRGVTNLDLAQLTGISALADGDEDDADAPRHGIHIRKTINIAGDVGDVFGFFSNYDNFPLFMHNVREVRDRGDGYSHWTVAGPAGMPISWDALLTDYEPNRCIAWESVRRAAVANCGVIRFDENPDGSTRVDIRLCYNPPGGVIAHALAWVMRSDPKSEMDEDLARLKTLIERGRFPHDAAQHASVMSPASPAHVQQQR